MRVRRPAPVAVGGSMSAMRGSSDATDIPTVEGAGGIVFNRDGAVLLIRHRRGEWVFPKGHLERGESFVDTAVREVEEEAGVAASCPDPGRTWTTEYVNARGQPRKITWFVLSTDSREPTMREAQFPEGAFVAPAAALDLLSFDEDRALLARVLASR